MKPIKIKSNSFYEQNDKNDKNRNKIIQNNIRINSINRSITDNIKSTLDTI